MHFTRSHILTVAVPVLLVTGAWLFAGPLNPPAGPVASTYKTLTEVEPRTAINATNTPGDASSLYKITLPGSYYLTGNITGVAGKHGIVIAASGVTLDLNGFDLAGIPAMGGFDGVSAAANNLTSITVVNGSIRNWGDEGVDFVTFLAFNCRVAGVLADGNAGSGIAIGPGGTVTDCSAYQNGSVGIFSDAGGTVTKCSASGNSAGGFFAISGVTIINCSANQNADIGISAGTGSTVADCTVRSNAFDGIDCISGCMIRDNTCSLNGAGASSGAGIHILGADNRIEGNNCTGADRGIHVEGPHNIIIRNTCAGNNPDWTIVFGNYYGPIIDRRASVPAGVNGFAAISTLATTDPFANFSY